jgi:hypothetical protein
MASASGKAAAVTYGAVAHAHGCVGESQLRDSYQRSISLM